MSKKIVATGIVAAAAGAIAGILFAPKSGKETRADIKQKAGEAKEFAVKQAGVVKDKASAGFAAAKKAPVLSLKTPKRLVAMFATQ